MYCRACGTQLPLTAQFCNVCGERAAAPERVRPQTADADDYATKVIPASAPQGAQTSGPVPAPGERRRYDNAGRILLGIFIGLAFAGLGRALFPWISGGGTSRPSGARAIDVVRPLPSGSPIVIRVDSSPSPAPTTNPASPSSVGDRYPPAIVTKYVHPTYQAWHYRVRFKPGYEGGVVRDEISRLVRYYILNAREGQTMTVSLRTPTEDGRFDVLVEDGQKHLVTQTRGVWSGVLPETGDYSIYVHRGEVPAGPAMPIEMVISLK